MLASVASMIDQFNMPNIKLLQHMGYEVHVACNFKKGSTCSDQRIRKFQDVLSNMHVVWHQWDCPRAICPVTKCLTAFLQLWKLTGQYHYVWLHCHSPVGAALARIVAHGRNIRVIYTAHGFHFYQGAPVKNWLLYYPAEKLLAKWTDVLITVNQEDYQFAKRNLNAKKIYCIPGTGVKIGYANHIKWSRQKLCKVFRIPESAWILLSVGELTARKNHRLVLEAMTKMRGTDVYYIICGQGRLCRKLREYARQNGLLDRLRLAGYQEHLDEFYCNCDIFVFPSVQEGLPVALMEAMAAGMPCAVSDIRGNRELIRESERCGTALSEAEDVCFPYDDADRLSRILLHMMEDKNLRRSCAFCNRKASKRYDIRTVCKKMRDIYRQMDHREAYIEREFQDGCVTGIDKKPEDDSVTDGQ